ncbi:N-acetylmuramoyl-L-alanine amidase [Clostridium sp. ZS2-4]|uniref:N-acetylmuramoyl-L-alanine amidase n=1 Tax=Clostridium sp. ZS2-4 TaxID=2987703 RepID=UPI00227BF784|nr:N-acetylmuramoyl-L-alanine amidase [Clostridium sp. ZS2-4]MCY6356509.1 N-acetylmuramoyl-L-alanine amidase [Clostridium sp. ZS2-4]
MKIFIDPGHGGNDPGTVANGLREKELVLDISLRQKELFEKLGHEVRMSRSTDRYVSLRARTSKANQWGADVFISNHINAGGGVGEEVWYSIYGGKGKQYAANVERNLSEIFKSRGIKKKSGRYGDYLYIIRTTTMPAILNEFGFIDRLEDYHKLNREDIRQKCAEAVVYGILE